MKQQFRLSVSPNVARSNVYKSISLKHDFMKQKKCVIDQCKNKQTIDSSLIRKKYTKPNNKRILSIVDFSEILDQKLKFPSISNSNLSLLMKIQTQTKDTDRTLPPKIIKKKFLLKSSNGLINIRKKIPSLLTQNPESKSLSDYPNQSRKISIQQHFELRRNSSVLPQIKRQHQLDIQPWQIDSQCNSTSRNFKQVM